MSLNFDKNKFNQESVHHILNQLKLYLIAFNPSKQIENLLNNLSLYKIVKLCDYCHITFIITKN